MDNVQNTSGRKELTNQKFGKLTVINYAFTKDRRAYWNCLCECGKSCNVRSKSLLNGDTRSCGCLYGERHGGVYTVEYTAWLGMRDRCYRKTNKKYSDYGGRGISVCDSWNNSFLAFLNDMGFRPSKKHSLDRFPDNNGNYEPGNCRWATQSEQCNNRRSNVNVTIEGVTKTASEWAVLNGVSPARALYRIKIGWNPVIAVTKPSRKMTYVPR